jgi:LEA14-like dessication related protein
MKHNVPVGIVILLAIFALSSGCMEPPVKDPTVSVSNIALSDVSLQTMTVNATVSIYNPNPVGAKLKKVAFDVYYLDDTQNYLGHGEKANIMVKENGNTTVFIPVTIENVQAVNAIGSLIRKGSIMLNVNGSAVIDIKVTSFEKRFEQNQEFLVSDFESLLPVTTIPGSGINVTNGIQQLGGLLGNIR